MPQHSSEQNFYLTSLRFDLKYATHSKSRKTKILIPPKLASFVKKLAPKSKSYLLKPSSLAF